MPTPDYFTEYKELIPDFEGFLEAHEHKPPTYLRLNTLRTNEEDFLKRIEYYKGLSKVVSFEKPFPSLPAYTLELNDMSPGAMLEHALGHFFVQGVSSLLPVIALNVAENMDVLDMCAAPGGKTTMLAEHMKNTGMLIGNEMQFARLMFMRANLDRMGVVNCIPTQYNGEKFPDGKLFDRILLDGPCSSEGTFRGKKLTKYMAEKNIPWRESLWACQKRLIIKAFDLLKPGGAMVYSTCTYDPRENEAIVQHLIDLKDDAQIVEMDFDLPLESGVESFQNLKFSSELKKSLRVYPHKINSWGFYLAKIIKRS